MRQTARQSGRPLIGITADLAGEKFTVAKPYSEAIRAAGGLPLVLPCMAELAADFVHLCDGILLTGGDDPITTHWGVPVHPNAKPVDPQRQDFELALLAALDLQPHKPVLGVCLGMQYMGLHCGGTLDQNLPDSLPTAADHWDRRAHEIHGELGSGLVNSHHRQALSDPGAMRVVATAPDGVIEAVQRDDRPFYLGVQWHPERTDDEQLGRGLIRRFVQACAEGMNRRSARLSARG